MKFLLIILALTAIDTVIIVMVLFNIKKHNENIYGFRTPAAASVPVSHTAVPTPSIPPSPSPSVRSNEGLRKAVEKAIGENTGLSVAVENLKTGESYYKDADREFHPASLYKLFVMSAAVSLIESGNLKYSDILSADIAGLNREFSISPEQAEITGGIITLSTEKAMEQMITISDNYAAMLLSDRVKFSYVNSHLTDIGLVNSSVGENLRTTAGDVFLFFHKLYLGELANPENTAKMTDLLKNQQRNTKLPDLLPKKTVIAHKTGELDSYSHDGGIVFNGRGDYVIVVLTEGDSRRESDRLIAGISKAVYDYFEGVYP